MAINGFWTKRVLTADQFSRLEFPTGDIPDGVELELSSDGSGYELIVDALNAPDAQRYIDAIDDACDAVGAD